METITVNTLDYYNKPEYYRFMPKEIFDLLDASFLSGSLTTELPKDLLNKMVEEYEASK